MESQRKFLYESVAAAIAAGVDHHQAGRIAEADKVYRQVLVREPSNPDALFLLGLIHGQRGNLQSAIDLISRAIKREPDMAQFHFQLAEFLKPLKRYDESIAAFRRAIELTDNDPVLHNSFGALLGEMRKTEAAMAEFRRAIEIKPDYAEAHSNLGATLVSTGALDEAIAAIDAALRLNPDFPGAYNNLGNALFSRGDIAGAIGAFKKVLTYHADNPKIHLNLAGAYLLSGDFSQGWREHEWRLKMPEIAGERQLPQPRWDGSSLNGKRMLLLTEQGLGDMIQFARFIVPVAAWRSSCAGMSAGIIAAVPRFPRRRRTGIPGDPLPDCDLHCSLLSLGHIFNIDANTIPGDVPYVKADQELARKWAQRFDAGDKRLRVGLVWAGSPTSINDRNRSMAVKHFALLGAMDSIAFYSLQKNDAAVQTVDPPDSLRLIDWTADLNDFADTAALIENLDLVLTVDTAVAHLAGAMGKRVWLMLARIPDWRWMLDREDSPWYPTMRLFRQKNIGDWPEVLQRVAGALQDEIG